MSTEIENSESLEFTSEKNGYNRAEVSDHIKMISTEIEQANDRILEFENEIKLLNSKLDEYEKIDRELRDALIYLKESEKETILRTRNEASELLNEAENKSNKIIEDAEEEAKSTRDTLLFLKEQQEILVTRLKIIVDSQEGLLNDLADGKNTAQIQRSMAEAASFRTQTELNIDTILEKLL